MKKILLIVLVLIVGCAKEPEPINLKTLDEIGSYVFYTKDTNKPYTGAVFELYKSREKKLEGYLKNGKLDGKFTEYYEPDNSFLIKRELSKSFGGVDGFSDYENGPIKQEGNFKDGKKDGEWPYYERGSHPIYGKILRKENYKDGVKVDDANKPTAF